VSGTAATTRRITSRLALPVYCCARVRPCTEISSAPSSTAMRANSGALTESASHPDLIFTEIVPEKLRRMARTIAAPRARSRSRAEPARFLMNFFTGQPALRSIHTAPSPSSRRQASPRISGSEPNS
jgi:hypothetical protein